MIWTFSWISTLFLRKTENRTKKVSSSFYYVNKRTLCWRHYCLFLILLQKVHLLGQFSIRVKPKKDLIFDADLTTMKQDWKQKQKLRIIYVKKVKKSNTVNERNICRKWFHSSQYFLLKFMYTKFFKIYHPHCVKSVQIRSIFWSIFSRISTRKYSVFGHFSHSA